MSNLYVKQNIISNRWRDSYLYLCWLLVLIKITEVLKQGRKTFSSCNMSYHAQPHLLYSYKFTYNLKCRNPISTAVFVYLLHKSSFHFLPELRTKHVLMWGSI